MNAQPKPKMNSTILTHFTAAATDARSAELNLLLVATDATATAAERALAELLRQHAQELSETLQKLLPGETAVEEAKSPRFDENATRLASPDHPGEYWWGDNYFKTHFVKVGWHNADGFLAESIDGVPQKPPQRCNNLQGSWFAIPAPPLKVEDAWPRLSYEDAAKGTKSAFFQMPKIDGEAAYPPMKVEDADERRTVIETHLDILLTGAQLMRFGRFDTTANQIEESVSSIRAALLP